MQETPDHSDPPAIASFPQISGVLPAIAACRLRTGFWLALGLIVLLAGEMRLTGLNGRPNGLFRDEAEKGYDAWALATTGGVVEFHSATGGFLWRRLPWMIDVMGSRTSAIYQYCSVPFVGLGGLTVGTTRATAGLAGTLAVLLVGMVIGSAWGAPYGLAAALWLALCPWHLVFSRWALQGIFVPLLLVGVLLGLWGVERRRRWGWPLAGAAMGWLFYAYSGAQPFVLAWGLCLLVLYRRSLDWRGWPFWVALALFLLPVAPTVAGRLSAGGSARLAHVAIWSEPGIAAWQVPLRFIQNYLAHFNPVFLFISGDPLPRHCLPGHGQLLLVDVLLLPVGLIGCFRKKMPLRGALLAALLCGPVPAALTRIGIPHALRAIAMVVPLTVWSGAGMVFLAQWLCERLDREHPAQLWRSRAWVGLFIGVLVLFGLNEFRNYWSAAARSPLMLVAFEAGERDAWQRIARQRQPGQHVYVDGRLPYAPYFQLFFLKPAADGLARRGLENQNVTYFDPRQTPPTALWERMRPGDWLLEAESPLRVFVDPTGIPLISREELGRIGESWVRLMQK